MKKKLLGLTMVLINPELDKGTIRVVSEMTKWIPGRQVRNLFV